MGSGMKDMHLGVIPPSENAGGMAPWVSNSNNSELFNEPNKGNPIEHLKRGFGFSNSDSQMKQNKPDAKDN
jgi:hypothetical protein